MAGVGSPRRPGIVHRLDKGTSGLIVLAKTQAAYEALTGQLARRSVSRRYLCLVQGSVRRARGVIDTAIGRDPRSRLRMAVLKEGRGKRAVTHFRVLERLGASAGAVSFLECRLETGRTHQIRVHLAESRMPILGDVTYGPHVKSAARCLLHASRLELVHPVNGRKLVIESPLPVDFERALSRLGGRLSAARR